MAACRKGYTAILVESFEPKESGDRAGVHIRPCKRQPFPRDMLIECSDDLKDTTRFPIGTVFRLCVRPKQKVLSRVHLYSPWQWEPEVVKLGKRRKGAV